MRLIARVAAGINPFICRLFSRGRLLLALGACLFALRAASAVPCACDDGDTLQLSGRTAVFYTLSQAEFDALDSDDQQAYSELLGDFYEYAEKLSGHLSANQINVVVTGSSCVEIKTISNAYCYNTRALAEEVGVIFSDGAKVPLAVPGVFSDPEILPIVTDYYSLAVPLVVAPIPGRAHQPWGVRSRAFDSPKSCNQKKHAYIVRPRYFPAPLAA